MPIKKHNCAWPPGEKIKYQPDTPYLNLMSPYLNLMSIKKYLKQTER